MTAQPSWKIPPCAGAAENPDTPPMRLRVWGRLCLRGQFFPLPVSEVSPNAGLPLYPLPVSIPGAGGAALPGRQVITMSPTRL